ncbi:single-stranded DNA-binding protein [Lacticaseibacillus mingshuiensis]|uniref:single-stranded DNA-binding protein n=1 Tax=Lacticaseibacillus mingshuiensis TaxID=2799574 RepID=UPI001940D994|nr:single-stranded DNA-binding protein [Lacticaseibacillus mingshuiensis]
MNNVNMIGRLAMDVKVGNNVSTSLLAVKRIYKSADSEDTDFIPISTFGRNADVLSKYCKKGDKVGVSGRIKTSTYTDKQGVAQHGFEVVAEHIYLLSNSKQSHSQSHEDSQAHNTLTDADVNELSQRLHQASKTAEVTVGDSDLPF